MKPVKLLIIALFSLFTSGGYAQELIYIGGQVTSIETGFPVAQQEVAVGMATGHILVADYTDENGFYSLEIPASMVDSTTILYVWVSDCNQQLHFQTFTAIPGITIVFNFEICTLNTNCLASFIFRYDTLNPQLIYFENLSFPVNNTTDWVWDFGDGTVEHSFSPVHEYTESGIYNVCLVMTDSANNCSNTFCIEIVVNYNPGDCQAMFSWFAEALTVTFNDLSTGSPDSYFWDFGDGTVSNEINPVHTWQFSGTYQVCLSIFNSLTLCESTYCDFINVGNTLPDCVADYTYQQLEGNTYSFTNLSTGLIDDVIWDFGDGTPFSHETNPVHTWQQAGIYQVCLAVISNYTGCQDVLCIDITVGDTISACQAAFSVRLDSIPGNINHYWFIDESSGQNITNWFWDFGDGTISFMQHPEHTFAESGTYTIYLAISGTGNAGFCADTIYQTITTPSYSNLGGQIFAGNFPINNPDFNNDAAMVRLFRKTGNKHTEVASGLFLEYGYYFFLDVPEGNYVVHAELMPGSPSFMSYIPAYSGETTTWQTAQQISLQGLDIFEAHVYMPRMTMPGSGPGTVTGNIVSIDNSPFDPEGKLIFLYSNDSIVAYSHTDQMGNFEFNAFPFNNYTLKAEIAGHYSSLAQIILSESQVMASDIQIEISSAGVFGFEELPVTNISDLRLYPNPVENAINICIRAAVSEICIFKIISSAGAVVSEATTTLQAGDNKITLDAGNLKSGLYLITCYSENDQESRTMRFIKK